MNQGRIVVYCIFGLGLGIWLFISSFKKLRLRRAVENTPRSKIRSAAMGKCEVQGRAKVLGEALTGPFSGLPCLWYHWKVEEARRDSRGNTSWSTLDEGKSFEAFSLEDETGSIRIEPRGAEVESSDPLVYLSGSLHMMSQPKGPEVSRWIGSAGIFSSERRLSEWMIYPEVSVLVLGVLREVENPLSSTPEKVIMLGRAEDTFFISTHSQQEVEQELFWSVWGRMLGGACLAIASLALGAAVLLGV
jgi:hypothetical protein